MRIVELPAVDLSVLVLVDLDLLDAGAVHETNRIVSTVVCRVERKLTQAAAGGVVRGLRCISGR